MQIIQGLCHVPLGMLKNILREGEFPIFEVEVQNELQRHDTAPKINYSKVSLTLRVLYIAERWMI